MIQAPLRLALCHNRADGGTRNPGRRIQATNVHPNVPVLDPRLPVMHRAVPDPTATLKMRVQLGAGLMSARLTVRYGNTAHLSRTRVQIDGR